MKRFFSWRVFGANQREFRTSVKVALIGFVLVWIQFPPTGESSRPDPRYLAVNVNRPAWEFVVAFISLLCAINAYRDEDNEPNKRALIVAWCIVLGLWIFFSLWNLWYWWGRVPPLVKPSWLQGPDV